MTTAPQIHDVVGLRVGDEPVVGWRWYHVDFMDISRKGKTKFDPTKPRMLRSLVHSDEPWIPAQRFEASCARGRDHPAPELDCSCGVYASRRSVLIRHSSGATLSVHAKVALWGKIIEHTSGWRGQYCYPQELEILAPWGRERDARPLRHVAAQLASSYRVPVTVKFAPSPKTVIIVAAGAAVAVAVAAARVDSDHGHRRAG